ncbi:MAG TPA: pyridoxal phosphate-dependent aminotransferase [Armatimonadota bacterium]|jgi:aspartate aminotransferase
MSAVTQKCPGVSARAAAVAPSPTLAVTAKFKKMVQSGVDCLGFAAGEPDFDTPDNIKQAAIASIQRGETKYTPTMGLPALREAIRRKLEQENKVSYETSEIIVSVGAKHSLFNAVMATVNPGDEALIPEPYWVTYPEQVGLAGGTSVFVPTSQESNFRVSFEAIRERVTDRTRLLFLNSPSNPAGAMVSDADLQRIAELAVERNLWVISDEIYEKLIYVDQAPRSIASLGPEVRARTITVNGVSKTYAMTGWRVGYAAGPAEVVAAMGRIQDQSTSNPANASQYAALEALVGPQDLAEQMRQEFAKRRKVLVDGLNAIPGITCQMPDGAFYVFPRVADLYTGEIRGSDDFANFLLEDEKVAVIPGSGFGADEFVRLSFATSMDTIEKGLERLHRAAKRLLG